MLKHVRLGMSQSGLLLGLSVSLCWGAGLPKSSVQAIVKNLQDSNVEVRVAAAQALTQVPDKSASKSLENALIVSANATEQEALTKALEAVDDSGSVKRLSDALANPQFTWGAGAKPRAIQVIGKIGKNDATKWLTALLASEQEPAVRAAALRALGDIGAPPKKEKELTMQSSLISLTVLCGVLSACVPVPMERLPQAPGSTPPTAASFPDVEPSATTHASLHFALRGYSDTELRAISNTAEDIFNKIGIDTGLYSYLAGQTYTLVVYKDQAEYAQKTKQTGSSRAVVAGNALYTYPGPELDAALAHHLMHLIFNAYMGEKVSTLQWLNEGLAMHEEATRMSDSARVNFQTIQSNKLRTDRMPFSQMTFFVGTNEENRRQEVWNLQTESVVSFIMKQGTSLTFAAFLNELRNGSDLDRAIANNYSGKFRGVGDLEVSWQSSL